MKIELMVSNTYVCLGKVYNKGFVYEIDNETAEYLLTQSTERGVSYFRKAGSDAEAFHPATKPTNKGGKPAPVNGKGKKAPAKDADAPMSWADLKTEGKRLGLYKGRMSRADLQAAIDDYNSFGNDDAAGDDDGGAIEV